MDSFHCLRALPLLSLHVVPSLVKVHGFQKIIRQPARDFG